MPKLTKRVNRYGLTVGMTLIIEKLRLKKKRILNSLLREMNKQNS